MGDSKRRKEALGENYGQQAYILPWLPITKTQAQQFVKWSNRGAWIGISFLIGTWVTIRFIGSSFDWWQVN